MRSKRGSAAVFILVMMTALMGLFQAYIGFVREEAVSGTTEALGRLWARSVIAEYDRRLFEDYGILAYSGTPAESAEKIISMAEYTFDGKEYAEVGECVCVPDDYSLADTKNFKRQILTAGAASEIDLVIQDFTEPFAGETHDIPESEERTIRNRRLLNSLPSAGRTYVDPLESAGEFFSSLGSLRGLLEAGTDRFLIDRYIRTHFRNMVSDKSLDHGYLIYEEEYILCGRHSDAANRRGSKAAVIGVREAMNLAYLNTCEDKKNEALIAAAVIMPEAPEVMQEALLAAWALAESFNDYELLIRGHSVPFVKTDENWATGITSALEGLTVGYIDTGCEDGETYQDYLSALICLIPEDIKLLRIMDLIQIDLKYTYRSDFLISDCYIGLDYIIEVNGKDYVFSEKY